MRTTMSIDDDVLQQAKQRAAETGETISDLVNKALRQLLATPLATRARESGTITYGVETATGPDDAQLRQWQQRLDDDDHKRQVGL
jgi:antitoxin component of RelBE/YafQ-DinJ toxin-antitoxin module